MGAAYTQAAKSGDPYTRRAWAENLPGALAGKNFRESGEHSRLDLGMLTRQVKNDYAAIVDTPELQAIREKQAELTGRTAELLEVTADLDQFYSRDDAPVRGLFSGIRGGEFRGPDERRGERAGGFYPKPARWLAP